MTESVQNCVNYLRECGATEVYVFGSLARGTATSSSDIDLAVRGLPEKDYLNVLGDLLLKCPVSVDLVRLDDGSSFAKHIESKIENGWATRVG